MRQIFIIVFLLIFSSCAIQVAPAGGAKDTTPPKVSKVTPGNLSTNVFANDIAITFDEFILLKDVSTQLVVSPLLQYPPTTKIRKKTLYIHLTDTLKENTTYTLSFGNSISDLNEGNVLDNYQYVFSTGPILDSMKIKGTIETAFDHKKDKGVFALLYKSNDDSLPFKERPMYFGKTNPEGEFSVNNISAGKYKVIALDDKDGNYLYTKGAESIGFLDSMVDAGNEKLKLRLFKESEPLRIVKTFSVAPGQTVLVFSAPADTLQINWITNLNKLNVYAQVFSEHKDSLTIWYKNIEADSLSFFIQKENRKDTVDIRLFKKSKEQSSRGKFSLVATSNDPSSAHNYFESYKINFNHPISSTDIDKFILKQDSVLVSATQFYFLDSLKTQLAISFKWKEKSNYDLTILPNAAKDIYELTNDTTNFQWKVKSESDYGTLSVKMPGDKENKILQLIDEKGNVIRQTYFTSDTTISYLNLDPRLYRLKLIHDTNRNGKWDTGNLIEKIQPEKTEYHSETFNVRANWDVEVKWNK